MTRFLGCVAISSFMMAGTALAHGAGPGAVFSCEGGEVRSGGTLVISSSAPKGPGGGVPALRPGDGPEQVCTAIAISAVRDAALKVDVEAKTRIVVYGSDIMLGNFPSGVSLRINKF